MLIARTLVFLLLLSSALFFAVYAATGQVRYRRLGLVILKWTVIAGLVFFAVLFITRLM
ncbi:MAG: hypothetical protein KDF25_07085 [Burkholderiaceae bacterium]|jgi:hypothetical protein|nr:hypothetical protein [Burkholderiaceae bacterium]